MKKYTFISELSPADVFHRLKANAKLAKFWEVAPECNRFFYRFYKCNRFYLAKTTDYGFWTASPFFGRVSVDDTTGKTVLTGRFFSIHTVNSLIIPVVLIPIIYLLILGFTFVGTALLLLAVGLILVTILLPHILGKNQRKEVLLFIEQFLLK